MTKHFEELGLLINQLESAIIEAEKYKTIDKGMEYAFKYGLLLGNVKIAILELKYLNLNKS
jgi:hypothetical protein